PSFQPAVHSYLQTKMETLMRKLHLTKHSSHQPIGRDIVPLSAFRYCCTRFSWTADPHLPPPYKLTGLPRLLKSLSPTHQLAYFHLPLTMRSVSRCLMSKPQRLYRDLHRFVRNLTTWYPALTDRSRSLLKSQQPTSRRPRWQDEKISGETDLHQDVCLSSA